MGSLSLSCQRQRTHAELVIAPPEGLRTSLMDLSILTLNMFEQKLFIHLGEAE